MTPFSVASLFFFSLLLLLLPAQYGASSHASYYMQGYRRFVFKTPGKSSGNSQQASTVPPATTCSSIANGLGNKKIPVVHRQSPCSPLHKLLPLSAADVLRRDTSRIRRRRFSSQSSVVAAQAPSPAAPINGSYDPSTPGVLDYSLLVSYGTPEQQLPVFLDNSAGMFMLWCKPCPSGSDDCEPAFDMSRSSTFTHVPCGSPDCPTNCSSGSVCHLVDPYKISFDIGTFSRDVLTLVPSVTVHDFRFVCIDIPRRPGELPGAGWLDLSRDRNSLPSRLLPSRGFSYCMSQYPDYLGYLFLGDGGTVGGDNRITAHAPLVSKNDGNPELASMYFIDLVGMSLGGEDLPILASSFGVNGSNVDTGTAITLLPPDAYTPLRDAFRKEMSQYNSNSVPGFGGFDTCYNFTELQELEVPLIELKFGNGDSLLIDVHQVLYYDDPTAGPFTVTCLAFSDQWIAGDDGAPHSVIGTHTLATTEVVYDVAGGKVGFIPGSC